MFVFGMILIIGGIAAIIFAGQTTSEGAVKGGGAAAIVLGFILSIVTMFYIVNPGEVGFELLFGKVQQEAQNGFHGKNPFSDIIKFDVKTKIYSVEAEGASRDLQTVKYQLAVNYRLDYTKVGHLYQEVGHDYEEKVLAPTVQEVVKACSSKFGVEEIITKRIDLKNMIDDMLMTRLSNFYIVLQGVNIVNIDFDAKFKEVVEAKQIEEQKIKTAEYVRMQAEQEKQTTILQAQAEAEKQRLLRDTTSREVIELKRIEKWNGVYPQVMGGNNIIGMKIPGLSE